MGAPAPELVDLWLARAFNAQDIEAAAALYHPDARVVRLEHVHGSASVAHGATEIRETMAGYVGLRPRMDKERGVVDEIGHVIREYLAVPVFVGPPGVLVRSEFRHLLLQLNTSRFKRI
jgi:hypothetical protein